MGSYVRQRQSGGTSGHRDRIAFRKQVDFGSARTARVGANFVIQPVVRGTSPRRWKLFLPCDR
jgi:hypothetical protein